MSGEHARQCRELGHAELLCIGECVTVPATGPTSAPRPKTIKLRPKGDRWEAWWKEGGMGSLGDTRTEALHHLAEHLDRMDEWVGQNFPAAGEV